MTLGTGDISFVLSGGSSNSNPLLSLGGMPSSVFIGSGLFNDLTNAQITAGYTDFRCLYVANDNPSEALNGASVYLDEGAVGGVDISVGFAFRDDVQQVSVINGASVSGGTFTVSYEATNVVVAWAGTVNSWAANFQTALRLVSDLGDVVVTGTSAGTTIIFNIQFLGVAGDRYHPVLQVVSQAGISPGTLAISKVIDGSPINSVADETDAVTTTPNNIIFSKPTALAPLLLGDLRPTDVVPVWMRRTAAPGQKPLTADGFNLEVIGT